MVYISDSGLTFLEKCSSLELEPLFKLLSSDVNSSVALKSKEEKYGNQYHRYWKTIAEELQVFGGHTVSNLSGCGRLYKSIVEDACDHLSVEYHKGADVATLETRFIWAMIRNHIAQLTEEESRSICEQMGLHELSYDETFFQTIQRYLQQDEKFRSYIYRSLWRKEIKGFIKGQIIDRGVSFATKFIPGLNIASWGYDIYKLGGPAFRITVPAIFMVADLRLKHLEYDENIRPRCMPMRGSVVRADLGVKLLANQSSVIDHSGICINDHEVVEIYNNKGKSEIRKVDWFDFVYGDLDGKLWGRSGCSVQVAVDQKTGRVINSEAWARYAEQHIGQSKVYQLTKDNCHTFSYRCITGIAFDKTPPRWAFSDLEKEIGVYGNNGEAIAWKVCDINPEIGFNAPLLSQDNVSEVDSLIIPDAPFYHPVMAHYQERIEKLVKQLEKNMINPLTGTHFEKSRQLKENMLKHSYTALNVFSLANQQLSLGLDEKILQFNTDRHQINDSVFTVAVFGQFSTGKSTFLNALSGLKELPMADERCTATFIRLKYCNEDEPYAEVRYKSSAEIALEYKEACLFINEIDDSSFPFEQLHEKRKELLEVLSHAQLSDYSRGEKAEFKAQRQTLQLILKRDVLPRFGQVERVAMEELNTHLTDDSYSHFIEEVTFYIKHPLLKDVEIVDTPGFGSSNQLHSRKTKEFIKKAHAIILLTEAAKPLQHETETDFLEQYQEVFQGNTSVTRADNLFLVLNKVDQIANDEAHIRKIVQDELSEQFDDCLIIPDSHIFSMSALYHLKADSGEPVDIQDYKHVHQDDLQKFTNAYQNYLTQNKDRDLLDNHKRTLGATQQDLIMNIKEKAAIEQKTMDDVCARRARFEENRKNLQAEFDNHTDAIAGLEQSLREFVNDDLDKQSQNITEEKLAQELNRQIKFRYNIEPNKVKAKHATAFYKRLIGTYADDINERLQAEHYQRMKEKVALINNNIARTVQQMEKDYEVSGLNDEMRVLAIDVSTYDVDMSLKGAALWVEVLTFGLLTKTSDYTRNMEKDWHDETCAKVRANLLGNIGKSTAAFKEQLGKQTDAIMKDTSRQLKAEEERVSMQQRNYKEFLDARNHVNEEISHIEQMWQIIEQQFNQLYSEEG